MKKIAIIALVSLATACSQTAQNNHTVEADDATRKPDVTQPVVLEESEAQSLSDRAGRAAPAEARVRKEYADAFKQKYASNKPAPATAVVGQLNGGYVYPDPTAGENYKHFDDNPVKRVATDPVSTFSIDVDTASYANIRRMLNQGMLPRQDAVRAEEMINYFDYSYTGPSDRSTPFSTVTEIAPSPWNSNAHLLHIGIQGYQMEAEQRPDANLVFLIDVSGSMNSADKLGLLKSAFKLLAKQLTERDRIAMVVYAGAAGTVLEPTPGNESAKIIAALERLSAGGSTNGNAGIRLAYNLAEQNFIKEGINRIILATDGDFNVGTTNFEALVELVSEKRKSGVSLTTLGFGGGNYNDHLMEQLADNGNGNYAYIDGIKEANKVLVNQVSSTLFTIAKDVKIQIEFNPAVVREYRLVGYENRVLNNEDFNNDKIDAGEIGAGHNVTAIYEIILNEAKSGWLEDLRYSAAAPTADKGNELAHLRIRYKLPDQDTSQLLQWPLDKSMIQSLQSSSENFRFAAAVAGFAQLLRGGKMLNNFTFDDVLELANSARRSDPFGYRGEFVQLVSLADGLMD